MFTRRTIFLSIFCSIACHSTTEQNWMITQSNGLKVFVVQKDFPMLRILLPGESLVDRGIEIEFPEHVTAINQGSNKIEHLYLITDGGNNIRKRPSWRISGDTIAYEAELMNRVKMIATARLEKDGLRFIYKFINHSDVSYSNLQAVTCVKLYSLFSDPRLERTYVHHSTGFDLLASETPERLTMPLKNWLPCRYLVSYTWPVPSDRIQKDEDSITRYYKSQKADKPFIATQSHDMRWIAATFTRETGNLWTNPERTCQHADPAVDVKSGETKTLELKTFVIRGDLSRVLALVNKEMEQ